MSARWLSLSNRAVLAWLRLTGSPAGDGLTGLSVTGVCSGREYQLPVLATTTDELDPQLVVLPGHPQHKTWWRNLDASGGPVRMRVLHRGTWRPAYGRVLQPDHPDYAAALETYLEHWPEAEVGGAPLVVVSRRRARAHDEDLTCDRSRSTL